MGERGGEERVRWRRALVVAAACAALLVHAAAAPAGAQLDEVDTRDLRERVTLGGVLRHAWALQFLAALHGGTRASGTPGYESSVAYVTARLGAAGYEVTRQTFTFPFFRQLGPGELARQSPEPTSYVAGTDFATLENSGSGEAVAPVVPVDVAPAGEPGGTSGCEAEDFAAFPRGAIALLERAACTMVTQVGHAKRAGASALVVFNDGREGRTGLLPGAFIEPSAIPAVFTTFAVGADLVERVRRGETVTLRVATSTEYDPARETTNVIATAPGATEEQTVVVGAHLDSVLEGPGINDNASAVGAVLETAERMAELGLPLQRRVRFAFWAAEEVRLSGSTHYVRSLSPEELAAHGANLNFDMLASPNHVRFVYDGDNSTSTPGAAVGPPGSAEIEALFARYFQGQGLATDPLPLRGRSDYAPFFAAGIPAGGLFTGAEAVKTEAQAAVYGGRAGLPYDPNYHRRGDTIRNVDTRVLDTMADAVAHATLTLARSRGWLAGRSITSERGR